MSSVPQKQGNNLFGSPEYWREIAAQKMQSANQQQEPEPEEQPKKKKKNVTLELLNMTTERCDLFYTDTGEAYATIRGAERDWTLKVRSRKFRMWLVHEYLEEKYKPANSTAV